VQRLTAVFVAELPGIRLARGLAPAALGPEPRFWFQDGTVTALDALLAPGASRPVDVPPGADFLAATPDLTLLIFATKHDVLLIGATGTARAPIAEAESAVVLPSGRVLITAPGDQHQVLLLDPATGKVVDAVELDTSDAGVTAVPHPSDGWVALDAGEGQDGSTVFRVREEADRLLAEELMSDVVLAGFDPSGSRVLITPHPSFGGPAEILSWPELEPLASLDEELDFDLYGAFVGADRVVLSTFEQGPLLCDGELRPLGWLDLGAYPVDDFEDTQLLGLGDGIFALDLYHDGSGHTTVWRIPAE
jgi:hypothetical protein